MASTVSYVVAFDVPGLTLSFASFIRLDTRASVIGEAPVIYDLGDGSYVFYRTYTGSNLYDIYFRIDSGVGRSDRYRTGVLGPLDAMFPTVPSGSVEATVPYVVALDVPGLVLSFASLVRLDTRASIIGQAPPIYDLGDGSYVFYRTYNSSNQYDVYFRIDSGVGRSDRYRTGVLGPVDYLIVPPPSGLSGAASFDAPPARLDGSAEAI